MSRPLRVFVSSTMRDLRNERAAVVRRLRELGFEPVNAEGLLPSSSDSWTQLAAELADSDLFVLLLGESYGWIPERGPKAELDQSVTELELRHAQALDLRVFVFEQNLPSDAPSQTKDARRRNAFRAEVAAWDGGYFKATFDLDTDLAAKVGEALVRFLMDRYTREQVRARGDRRAAGAASAPPLLRSVPSGLADAVQDREAVLFLGAGVSRQAELPTAAAFMEAMKAEIRVVEPAYSPVGHAAGFNALATDTAHLLGVERLRDLARRLVDPEGQARPTTAHSVAVRRFATIVTTNYDLLLERAGWPESGRVLTRHGTWSDGDRVCVKLHGSIDDPESLVLTERELARLDLDRPEIWRKLTAVLAKRPLVVVGSSLRDPSIVRLLEESGPRAAGGWAVLYEPSRAEETRLRNWGLDSVHADADSFFTALDRQLG